MKATYIRALGSPWVGDVALYELDEPVPVERGGEEKTAFVIVSASSKVDIETTVFPADSDGEILSWGEVGGACDMLDHAAALASIGCGVVNRPERAKETR